MEPREIIKSILRNTCSTDGLFVCPDTNEYVNSGEFTVYINFQGKQIKYKRYVDGNLYRKCLLDEELSNDPLVESVYDQRFYWECDMFEAEENNDYDYEDRLFDEDGNVLDNETFCSWFIEDLCSGLETMFNDDDDFENEITDFVIEHYNDIYKNAA